MEFQSLVKLLDLLIEKHCSKAKKHGTRLQSIPLQDWEKELDAVHQESLFQEDDGKDLAYYVDQLCSDNNITDRPSDSWIKKLSAEGSDMLNYFEDYPALSCTSQQFAIAVVAVHTA